MQQVVLPINQDTLLNNFKKLFSIFDFDQII